MYLGSVFGLTLNLIHLARGREWVSRLFARVGEVRVLPESQLDAFLALTSSGPAFVAVVAEVVAARL